MPSFKGLVRSAVRNLGYQIQKYPAAAFEPLPVFDVCVQMLMAIRGDRLTFIEVGANNGRYGDPLYQYVLDHPWRGILIEPQPDVFLDLRQTYADATDRLILENVAIASGADTITMYRGKGRHYPVTSMHRGVVAKLAPNNVETFTVPCTTLDALIQKHSMSHVDLLQIDAEGNDYDVLRTLDLAATTPLIIQFEHGLLSPHDVDAAIGYLGSNGYSILYGGHQIADTIAIHKSFPVTTDPRMKQLYWSESDDRNQGTTP